MCPEVSSPPLQSCKKYCHKMICIVVLSKNIIENFYKHIKMAHVQAILSMPFLVSVPTLSQEIII
jgi:hypothetical protein